VISDHNIFSTVNVLKEIGIKVNDKTESKKISWRLIIRKS